MPFLSTDRFGLIDQLFPYTATIPIGTSLSETIDLGGAKLIGFLGPAAWTAATLTLRASLDGVSYYQVSQHNGADITLAVTAGVTPQGITWFNNGLLNAPPQQIPFRYIQLLSGTSAAAVNQAAARVFTLLLTAPYGLPFR